MKNTYLVYHFDMMKYSCCFGKWYKMVNGKRVDSDAPSFHEEYEMVAEVKADCLDKVFEVSYSKGGAYE